MKKVMLVVLAMFLLVPTAWAGFINGGFEDGTFNGWTKGGGAYYSGTYSPGSDPGKSAIVSQGKDFYSGGNLDMVYSGNYSARINNYDWGYHYSTISQTVTNWTDDKIYFAWAAVLEDPGHSYAGHFKLDLTNLSTGTNLYSKSFDYYSAPDEVQGGWLDGYSTIWTSWKYSNWQIVSLDVSQYVGNNFQLTLLASDCGYGGHGGYAYLDGFGAFVPPPGKVPEPATALLLSAGLAGLALYRRRSMKK